MAAEPRPAPLGPDDLPIERFRSPEEQAQALLLFPRAYTSQVIEAGPQPYRTLHAADHVAPQLQGRPLLLRALAGRLMRTRSR